MGSKLLLVLACLVLATVSFQTFDEWAAGCGRTYASDSDREYRRGVYEENVAEMAAKNAQYEAEGKDTVLRPNCVFGDKTLEEARGNLLLIQPP